MNRHKKITFIRQEGSKRTCSLVIFYHNIIIISCINLDCRQNETKNIKVQNAPSNKCSSSSQFSLIINAKIVLFRYYAVFSTFYYFIFILLYIGEHKVYIYSTLWNKHTTEKKMNVYFVVDGNKFFTVLYVTYSRKYDNSCRYFFLHGFCCFSFCCVCHDHPYKIVLINAGCLLFAFEYQKYICKLSRTN